MRKKGWDFLVDIVAFWGSIGGGYRGRKGGGFWDVRCRDPGQWDPEDIGIDANKELSIMR